MKQHSVPFTILGNPFHLTDEVCRRLKEYGCEKYQLSIDGLRQTHDWFRKPGSFDITLEKIGCINRADIRSVVMTTVSGMNIDEVPGIIGTACRLPFAMCVRQIHERVYGQGRTFHTFLLSGVGFSHHVCLQCL